MVAGALACTLLAVDESPGRPCIERRRPQHEVDAHPAVALVALTVVIPVRVDLGVLRERTHHVGPAVLEEAVERRSLGQGHVGALGELQDIEHVGVQRSDIPVPHQGSVLARPGFRGLAQFRQPFELVVKMRIVDLAPVRHVQRPHPHPATDRTQGPRFRQRGLAETGHVRESVGDLAQAHPADDRDAVPLVGARGGHLVAHPLQTHEGELILARLGLLERQYVDLVSLQQLLHPIDPGTHGVDVPGGEAHRANLSEIASTKPGRTGILHQTNELGEVSA